ncbi:hypothetical protein CUJ83_10030 [Methanocella sp. CWC-04]|uniref:Uncharacterized protein n=1 Tax=Methanooceanicella nereidis TaxID=2052831 RepID=A0AAP2RFN3_9EURY|nr:hypothetical protein [Methanocella sp. CWC-04]
MRFELVFTMMSLLFTVIFLASSVYFETSYRLSPYSFLIAVVSFLPALVFFGVLYSRFRETFKYRAMSGRQGSWSKLMTAISFVFVAVASLLAYTFCFGQFGISMPWHGAGREYLYVSYFLLAEAALFLGRGIAYYMNLKKHMIMSLENFKR